MTDLSDVAERSLMVHKGGENHADSPEPLGESGARILCGVIPASQEATMAWRHVARRDAVYIVQPKSFWWIGNKRAL